MLQLFDRDFFKLSLGFLAIVSISLMIVFASRVYETRAEPRETVGETNA